MLLFVFFWLCFLQSFSLLQADQPCIDISFIQNSDLLSQVKQKSLASCNTTETEQSKVFSLDNKPLWIKTQEIHQCLMGIRNNYIIEQFLLPEVVDWSDENGRTLLHHALYWRRGIIAAILYIMGADINAQDKFGDTPLHYGLKAHATFEYEKQICVFCFSKEIPFWLRSKLSFIFFPYYGSNFIVHKSMAFQEREDVAFLFILSNKDYACLPNFAGESVMMHFTTRGLRKMLENAFDEGLIAVRDAIILELMKRRKEGSL